MPDQQTGGNAALVSARPVLLVLDYPGRRPEAHIADLGLEGFGFDCRHLLVHPLPDEVSTTAYAAELFARLPDLPTRPVAVLSYCATATLAASLASSAVGVHQRPLPVVFFDPSQCHVHHILDAYASVVRQIDGKNAAHHPSLDLRRLLENPRKLVDSIARDLARRAAAALVAEDFADDEASDLLGQVIDMYVEWITYLVAVHHRGLPVHSGEVLQVVSAQHPRHAAWLAEDDLQTVRIDCDRPSLLRDERTRDVVLTFLNEVAGRPAEAVRT
ncbi:hypothetical protein ABZ281_02455 [Streptomyces sp. NPDC006265]|uniref:hypothetical protein n=1 Tax=Streptomyces sp. NPDC006265 TaxID=3156740 RepID=UPI0033A4AB0A